MFKKIIFLSVLFSLVLAGNFSGSALAQFSQQGPKLVGTGAVGTTPQQGSSVSISADSNTAIVGGPDDNSSAGAAWVWTRSGGIWTQQGTKLVGSGAVGNSQQGRSVSLSADGNTAIVGGDSDNNASGFPLGGAGAAWVWTRSGGVWTQQGNKLVGSGAVDGFFGAHQGVSVSLSADGNTAIVGGYTDNSSAGAAWVWTRSGGVWTQQGTKLVGSGAVGVAQQGRSVSLSADGNTAIVGGMRDNSDAGAAWVWTRSGGVWTQQGTKLVGTGAVGNAGQGGSVSLSADGNTAIVGGSWDNSFVGAAWVWTRSGGVWTQQGNRLVGSGAVGNAGQGSSVSLSADGNTAISGGPSDENINGIGAAWVWARSGGVWIQQGNKLVGSGAVGMGGHGAIQGTSVSLSADGNTAIVGGRGDSSFVGAAWIFTASASTVPPLSPTPLSPGGATEGQTISTVTPTLQWTPGDGATSYAITISASPYGSRSVVYSNASAFGTTLTLPSGVLVNGGRYRWEMTAINSIGASVVSTSLYFQVILSGIPPIPPPPVALSPGSGLGSGPALDILTPTFRWTASTGASTYGLRISRSPFGPSDTIFSNLSITGPSFTLPGSVLAIGTQYRWNVTAINSGGESVASNSLSFVLRDSANVPTAAPTGLTATWVSGYVSLAWTDMSTNESGFKIERLDASGPYGQVDTTNQNSNTYKDITASTSVDHCYRVRATNGTGDSAYSNESCIARQGTATASQRLQFSSAAYPAGPSGASVTITRTGGSSGTVTVTVLVSQGTAVTGPDGDYFSLGPVAVTFAPGETSKTVTVLHVQLQRVDNRTVNLALTGPTGDATLGSPSAAVMTIQGTGSTPGKISILDPVCTKELSFSPCDGDGLLLNGFPDPAKLSQFSSVEGAAADGVTLLVLSVTSSTPVTFSLSHASEWPHYGTLMQLDGSGSSQSITVTPVGSTAFVLYQVPMDNPWLDSAFPLGVTAKNSTGNVANGTIYLSHAPVVLVHGLWSSRKAFTDMAKHLSANGLVGALTDYGPHSADSFSPFDESAPIDALVSAVELALNMSRGRAIFLPGQPIVSFGASGHRIAASQVDVVAHSMGGLVARAREKDKGPRIAFKRKENRNQGEFHKLITIGTPHQGSPLANWLTLNKCTPVRAALNSSGRPIGQAIYDFQTTSRTLFLLGSTAVPTHAIVGRKPAGQTVTELSLNTILAATGNPFVTVEGILGSHGEDDVIVPLDSQRGGMNDGTTATTVNNVIHFTLNPALERVGDDPETTSPAIEALVDQALRASTASGAFDSIPVFRPTGEERLNLPCFGLAFETAAGETAIISPAPIYGAANLRRGAVAASGVGTVSPAPGTVVRPGEVIQIVFSVPAASTSAMISIGGEITAVAGSAGSFSTSYELPSDAIGRINISATTLDLGDGNLLGETYVLALPSTPPAALVLSPGSVDFAVTGQTTALTVLGTYGDGATADLTPSASGTTYSTLSGTNSVITVSAEGVVQAVANGQDTVVIQNGGQTASVTATVNITNQPPTLAALADASVVAGQTLNIPVTASDPDGNTVQLSGSGLPSFVTLVDNHNGTGVLSVNPSATDVGTYPIFISAVDDGNPALGLSRSMQLTVFTAVPGDLNGDGVVTMADAIIALQVMARVQPSGLRSDYTTSGADVNVDGKMGIPELLYILQNVAGAR